MEQKSHPERLMVTGVYLFCFEKEAQGQEEKHPLVSALSWGKHISQHQVITSTSSLSTVAKLFTGDGQSDCDRKVWNMHFCAERMPEENKSTFSRPGTAKPLGKHPNEV